MKTKTLRGTIRTTKATKARGNLGNSTTKKIFTMVENMTIKARVANFTPNPSPTKTSIKELS